MEYLCTNWTNFTDCLFASTEYIFNASAMWVTKNWITENFSLKLIGKGIEKSSLEFESISTDLYSDTRRYIYIIS